MCFFSDHAPSTFPVEHPQELQLFPRLWGWRLWVRSCMASFFAYDNELPNDNPPPRRTWYPPGNSRFSGKFWIDVSHPPKKWRKCWKNEALNLHELQPIKPTKLESFQTTPWNERFHPLKIGRIPKGNFIWNQPIEIYGEKLLVSGTWSTQGFTKINWTGWQNDRKMREDDQLLSFVDTTAPPTPGSTL